MARHRNGDRGKLEEYRDLPQTPSARPCGRLDARSARVEIISLGREKINTLSLGTGVEMTRNLLGMRLQYGFSDVLSKVFAGGNPGPNAATNL